MKLAVIADVHGNSAALEAVLADIEAAGVTEVVNLGDHVSGPLDPGGTADLLMARGFPSIRGNHDRPWWRAATPWWRPIISPPPISATATGSGWRSCPRLCVIRQMYSCVMARHAAT
jgi:predicted phosphodiesterase